MRRVWRVDLVLRLLRVVVVLDSGWCFEMSGLIFS